MILTEQQITSIIKENPNRDIIKKGVDYNKLMRLHIYGDGLVDKMGKIEGFETDALQKLKALYARSNKDVFSRLGRPIDKVFSARGGSIYYNLSDSLDKAARALSLNVRNGFSIRKWVEMFWRAHLLDDPFGLVFLEIMSERDAVRAKAKGISVIYPTYKSITSIFDYQPKGSELEYAVFNVTRQDKIMAGIDPDWVVYRVVDDSKDYYIRKENDTITILTDHTYDNYHGYVPGMINSDLISPADETCFLSLYDDVLELANHFMLKGAIKLTHEFLHAYPKYWEYADSCDKCGGAKMYEGETCKACNGSGKRIMSKVSDAKLLDYPGPGDVTVTPDVAGYVSPDKSYYEIATTDLQLLEDAMNVTMWGAQSKIQTQPMLLNQKGEAKTATQVMDDIKPQADRLNIISEMAEKRHKFILDAVVKINLGLPGYQGASVNYGRRFMLESPDEIWDKYSNARTAGAAISVLDDLLEEYYEAKYAADPIKLAIQQKLMAVEPFVHLTADKVDMSASITAEDKSAKAYFGEWLSTVNEAMILSMSAELLREDLMAYAIDKASAVQQAQKDQATFEASLNPKQAKPAA